MAGDWIKMRTNLWDHPKVVRILSAFCPGSVRDYSVRCKIVGALYRTWALADAHSDDGILHGYDADALDFAVGIDGWSSWLQEVGWLKVEPQRLVLTNFASHNGTTAKRRSEEASRKNRVRKMSEKKRTTFRARVRKVSEKKRTREEKRREDINTPISPLAGDVSFAAFWAVVHIKVGRGSAERAYARAVKKLAARESDPHAFLRSRMEAFAASPAANPSDHTPVHPTTWLNQARYDDDPAAWQRQHASRSAPKRGPELDPVKAQNWTPGG